MKCYIPYCEICSEGKKNSKICYVFFLLGYRLFSQASVLFLNLMVFLLDILHIVRESPICLFMMSSEIYTAYILQIATKCVSVFLDMGGL